MSNAKVYSDGELIAAISRGEQLNSAILFIYQRYATTISSFIIAKGGTAQDAEDAFQETVVTFIDLIKHNKYRGEASLKTFLVAIARNLWLNELKKRERSDKRAVIFEEGRSMSELDVSEHMADREAKQQLRQVLDKLSEPCRKILTLFYYDNLSMKDMLIHLPYENEQVVRNKKYKCLQQLTDLIKQNPFIARLVEHSS